MAARFCPPVPSESCSSKGCPGSIVRSAAPVVPVTLSPGPYSLSPRLSHADRDGKPEALGSVSGLVTALPHPAGYDLSGLMNPILHSFKGRELKILVTALRRCQL